MLGREFPGAGVGLRQMMLDVGPDAAGPESSSGSPVFKMGKVFMVLVKKRGWGRFAASPAPTIT